MAVVFSKTNQYIMDKILILKKSDLVNAFNKWNKHYSENKESYEDSQDPERQTETLISHLQIQELGEYADMTIGIENTKGVNSINVDYLGEGPKEIQLKLSINKK